MSCNRRKIVVLYIWNMCVRKDNFCKVWLNNSIAHHLQIRPRLTCETASWCKDLSVIFVSCHLRSWWMQLNEAWFQIKSCLFFFLNQPPASLSPSSCLQHCGQEGSGAVCLQSRARLGAVLHRRDHLWERWVTSREEKGKNVGWCLSRNKRLMSKGKVGLGRLQDWSERRCWIGFHP